MKTFESYDIAIKQGGSDQQYVSCPQCSAQRKKKKARCLSVKVSEGIWNCHHCGWSGCLKTGTQYTDPAWNKPKYIKPNLTLKKADLPPKTLEWFRDRGISQDTLIKAKICIAKVYMPQVEEIVPVIGFPYFRDSELINVKWRDKHKNFRLETGAERILYGLDDIKDADTVYWVEGEMDRLSLMEIGINNCVSIPNGAPAEDTKDYENLFDYLLSAEKVLLGKKHVLFVDNDAAGKRLEIELSRRLGRESCERVVLPDKLKDANQVLMEHGREYLMDVIQQAKPYPVEGIHLANDQLEGVMRIKHGDIQKGVSTGWTALNYYYTVRLGELTIITGVPSHGKSNFLDCLLVNLAKLHNWSSGLFSPENQPIERHITGLIEKSAQMPLKKMSDDETRDMTDWVNRYFYWILPGLDDDWSLDAILGYAKIMVYRYGISVLVLDPWNEIEHKRPGYLTESEYISHALTKIRRFGREYNVHVFVVAHPTKPNKDNEDKPVDLYNISGSANWKNKADNGLVVYRHINEQSLTSGSSDKTTILVKKIRFKEIGRIGLTDFRYDAESNWYYEWSAAHA